MAVSQEEKRPRRLSSVIAVIGVVVCSLCLFSALLFIYVGSSVWIPAFYHRSNPIEVALEGIRFNILGQWYATNIEPTRFSFVRTEFPHPLVDDPVTVVLVIGKYSNALSQVEDLMKTDLTQTVRVQIHSGNVTYRMASPIKLSGEPGIGLVGSNNEDGSVEVRIDLPRTRIALLFSVVGKYQEGKVIDLVLKSLPTLTGRGRLGVAIAERGEGDMSR